MGGLGQAASGSGCICPPMASFGPLEAHSPPLRRKRPAPLPVRHPIAPHPGRLIRYTCRYIHPSTGLPNAPFAVVTQTPPPQLFGTYPTLLLATPFFFSYKAMQQALGQSLPFVGGSPRTPTYPKSSQQKQSKYDRVKYTGFDQILSPSRI